EVAAVQVLVLDEEFLQALVGELFGKPCRHLAPCLDRDLSGLGVDQIACRLDAAHPVWPERHAPAFLGRLPRNAVVERRQNLLVVESEGIEQRRHRKLPATVDAHIDDVLGVELEVEPGTAIRNDTGGEQELSARMGLAAVVVEEYPG